MRPNRMLRLDLCVKNLRCPPESLNETLSPMRDLPIPVQRVSTHAQGLRLRGTFARLATSAMLGVAFRARYSVGVPDWLISQLNGWPVCAPVNASPASLRTPAHDSGPVWFAKPSPYGSLIHLVEQHAAQDVRITIYTGFCAYIYKIARFRSHCFGKEG